MLQPRARLGGRRPRRRAMVCPRYGTGGAGAADVV